MDRTYPHHGFYRPYNDFSLIFILSFLSLLAARFLNCKTSSLDQRKFPLSSPPLLIQMDTSLIFTILGVGVAIVTMLCPVKEWLHFWCPRLWPPPYRKLSTIPADLESGLMGTKSAPADKAHPPASADKAPSIPPVRLGSRFELSLTEDRGD